MSFRSAQLLWLLAAMPIALVFLITRERHRVRIARRFASERLRGVSNSIRGVRPWLAAAGLTLLVIAMAGPRAGSTAMRISGREPNRIVAIDISNSMAAADIGTTRLAAAKAIARRVVDAHAGRVALVVFEGSAEVIAPLTHDNDAVMELIDTIQAGDIGQPGSDIGAAVEATARLAESDRATRADVVLISDGEDQGSRAREVIRRARASGLTVSTVLVGSSEGSTIPLGEGRGELRDASGQVVTTYARPEILRDFAQSTGGIFLENPFTRDALAPLLTSRRRGGARETMVQVPTERFQWPLAAAFLLLYAGSLAHRGAE